MRMLEGKAIKGGLLELKRKGLKITEYKEDIPRKTKR
jgi:hypothetical protein